MRPAVNQNVFLSIKDRVYSLTYSSKVIYAWLAKNWTLHCDRLPIRTLPNSCQMCSQRCGQMGLRISVWTWKDSRDARQEFDVMLRRGEKGGVGRGGRGGGDKVLIIFVKTIPFGAVPIAPAGVGNWWWGSWCAQKQQWRTVGDEYKRVRKMNTHISVLTHLLNDLINQSTIYNKRVIK